MGVGTPGEHTSSFPFALTSYHATSFLEHMATNISSTKSTQIIGKQYVSICFRLSSITLEASTLVLKVLLFVITNLLLRESTSIGPRKHLKGNMLHASELSGNLERLKHQATQGILP